MSQSTPDPGRWDLMGFFEEAAQFACFIIWLNIVCSKYHRVYIGALEMYVLSFKKVFSEDASPPPIGGSLYGVRLPGGAVFREDGRIRSSLLIFH
jgi:hypothetical protein